jgi:hypothetical protein
MHDAFSAQPNRLLGLSVSAGPTIDSGNDERATSASIQLHLNEPTSVCVVGNPVSAERRHRLANSSARYFFESVP